MTEKHPRLPVAMRYAGMATLLAECSRMLARLDDGSICDLMVRVESALVDYAEHAEVHGSILTGFNLSYPEPGEKGG